MKIISVRQNAVRQVFSSLLVSIAGTVMLSNLALAGDTVRSGKQTQTDCTGYTSPGIAQKEARYHPAIVNYSTRYDINPNLIKAVISVESCYDNEAVSSAGAQGLMQLMPKTAEWLGVSDANDSEQNLEAGIRYLSRLRKRFNNDTTLALAAYNAGPGNVKKYNGIPPFPETRAYVVKVEARFRHYQAQDQLAFNEF